MSETFAAAKGMFKENWPRSSTSPGAYGLSITLQRRSYARIGVWKGGVTIVFFPRAKALCLDEFRLSWAVMCVMTKLSCSPGATRPGEMAAEGRGRTRPGEPAGAV